MSRRSIGVALMVAGALIAVVGLVGWAAAGGGTEDVEAAPTTTTTTTPTTTTTTVPTTTTTEASTTTTEPTTTTTLDASGAIEDFVVEFAEAIANDNVQFLMESLHPTVLDLFDEASCRTFIEEEILLLESYRLTGEVEGPQQQTVADTALSVYQAPVAFLFQGQEFVSEAGFAFEGPAVRWFTQCGQ